MNEWNAAAPIIVEMDPDPTHAPSRPRLTVAYIRRWPRWQQAIVATFIWCGAWTLLIGAAAQLAGQPPIGYVVLFLAGAAIVFLLITAIAWRYGRLS